MNYIGLWIRIISLILILCLSSVISYICLKKTVYLKWIVPIAIVLLFAFAIFNVATAIVKPSVETFIGKYNGFSKEATSINFFSLEYCFDVNNENKYVCTDVISANIIYPKGMKEGQIYLISYETNENIVIGIEKVEKRQGGDGSPVS